MDDFIEPVGDHEIVGNLVVLSEFQRGRQKEGIRDLNTGCFSWQKELSPNVEAGVQEQCDKEQVFFQQQSLKQEMCEICLEVAPRDVHQQSTNGIKEWEINEKPKRRAEVQMRTLNESDKLDFLKVMQGEVTSYLDHEAVTIATRPTISPERILGMPWVLNWKHVENSMVKLLGRNPKPG